MGHEVDVGLDGGVLRPITSTPASSPASGAISA
jgi:hypothetical protein